MMPVAATPPPESFEYGIDIESFFERICSENSIIYFHNLAFDGSFILDRIMREGYRHVVEYAKPGDFETLISDMGKFYNIKVRWRQGGTTEFRDSLKKLPMSIDRIAHAFKLSVSKLSLDYTTYRAPGHQLTDDELEYLRADVQILAQALAQQLDAGMDKLTVGADSLAEFKSLVGSKMFNRMFPVLAPTIDADVRKAYRGGWTYCDSRTQGRIVGEGATYDVNSLYPSVMATALLPYGEPVWIDGAPSPTPEYPLYIVSVTFTATIKPGHVPCIQVKGSSMFGSTEYLSEIVEPVTLSITNVDLELWQEHYDLDILSYDGGWYFRGTYGVFNHYISKWMKIKNESDGGMKQIAKLHLNSLYGKFATNPNVTGKYPVLENNVVQLKIGDPETRDPVYTPMGVFITAYARRVTITAAQANYDTFAYADTDSIHLLTREPPIGVEVDPDKLGAWKREYGFTKAMFWRAKAYSELADDGTMHTHIAGLPGPVAERVTFDDYSSGKVFGGKLLPKRVPGGIVLVEGNFTLN